MIYLVAGLIIGFFVALPVGASAVMCISRSLQYGFLAGLYTGFGVALADLVYGILAVFGLICNFWRNFRKSTSITFSWSVLYYVSWFKNDV